MDRSNWFLRVVGNGRRGGDLSRNLPVEERYPQPWNSALDWLIKSGRFIFAIALVVLGLDHFLFFRFVASLVPPWIPWHLFWAFFCGCAFMAAGVSIATRWMGQLGATLIGTMFLLWFFVSALTEGTWARRNCGCAAQSK
jgi:hypothetical protein